MWAISAKFAPMHEDCSADLARHVKDLDNKINTFVMTYNNHSHNVIDGMKRQPDSILSNSPSSFSWKVESAVSLANTQFSNYMYRVHNNEKKICINFCAPGQYSNEFLPIECSFCSNLKKFDVESAILASPARDALSGK